MKYLTKIYLLFLTNKLIKNVPDLCNTNQSLLGYQSFIVTKNRKSAKQLEIITYQPKLFDIVDIKSIFTEHSKTSQKLSKPIRRNEKVDSNSSGYSHTKRSNNFLS